jgi:hypothetical protein
MYQIRIAIAGYVDVSPEVLDLTREYAFASGESTVCISTEYALSNLDPELTEGPVGELRELISRATRIGICDLMLSEKSDELHS